MESKKVELLFYKKKNNFALCIHTKNTLCLAEGNSAFISRIHLDLDSWQDFLDFQKDLKNFLKKKPKVFACDYHPAYRSTRIAESLSKDYVLKKIQHHHAHIASCMLENKLKNQKVIGVAFDGTGLGEDNTLWGGEFLLANYEGFKRLAHIRNVPLLGAEMAIRQPWRITFVWLYLIYRKNLFKLKIPFSKWINHKNYNLLKEILDLRFNSPLTSSMGRLFDAVGVLILNRFISQYEGQLPQELEKLAINFRGNLLKSKDYVFRIKKERQSYIIDPFPLIEGIVKDINRKENSELAFKFHRAVALMVRDVCIILRKMTKVNKVVLTGGVFQNNLLRNFILDLLYENKFLVFYHKEIPCFDAGLSLGQVAVANFTR